MKDYQLIPFASMRAISRKMGSPCVAPIVQSTTYVYET